MIHFIRDNTRSLCDQINDFSGDLNQTMQIHHNEKIYKSTLLIYAVMTNDQAAVELLIQKGVNLTKDNPWTWAKRLHHEEIAKRLPITFPQTLLIDLMQSLNYPVSKKGVCLGLSHMAKRALSLREKNSFNERLTFLANAYFQIEQLTLEQFNVKNTFLLNQQKRKKFDLLFKENVQSFFVQLKQNDPQQWVDVLAFFDGIFCYQKHPSSLYSTHARKITHAAAQLTAQLLQDETEYRGEFSGVYKKDNFYQSIQLLAKKIEDCLLLHPVASVLTSINHAITFSYDPTTKNWLYCHAYTLPIHETDSSEKFVEAVLDGFYKELNRESANSIALATALYTHPEDHVKADKLVQTMKEDNYWQKLHSVAYKGRVLSYFFNQLENFIVHQQCDHLDEKDKTRQEMINTYSI